jgi:hypothetical protein
MQSRTQSNACVRARMALALGKLNFSCAVIGLTFINRACRQRTGTPKFRGSGCQFPKSQCHPSPRTGIALGYEIAVHTTISDIELGGFRHSLTVYIQRRNEGLPEMQRANQCGPCGSLLFKLFILNAPFD